MTTFVTDRYCGSNSTLALSSNFRISDTFPLEADRAPSPSSFNAPSPHSLCQKRGLMGLTITLQDE